MVLDFAKEAIENMKVDKKDNFEEDPEVRETPCDNCIHKDSDKCKRCKHRKKRNYIPISLPPIGDPFPIEPYPRPRPYKPFPYPKPWKPYYWIKTLSFGTQPNIPGGIGII